MSTKVELKALSDQYEDALRRKDAAAGAHCYTEDAVYHACGTQPIRGREAIKALHEEIIETGFELVSITTTEVEAADHLGYAIQSLESRDVSTIALIVLKLDTEGHWKVCAEAEIALLLDRNGQGLAPEDGTAEAPRFSSAIRPRSLVQGDPKVTECVAAAGPDGIH